MRISDPSQGFTLLELMIVIAVTAILVTIGVPSFQSVLDKNKVKGAAEVLVQQLQFARTEAIKQNKEVEVMFDASGTDWCYGLDDYLKEPAPSTILDKCNCKTDPDKCTINSVQKVVTQADAKGVVIEGNLFGVADTNTLTFDPVRGTVSPVPVVNNDYVEFKSSKGYRARVRVPSALGRATICAPATGKVLNYPDC